MTYVGAFVTHGNDPELCLIIGKESVALEPIGAGMRRDEPAFLAKVNESLATMEKTGEIDAMISERETEILRRISTGGSNKEVVRQLGICPSTVRTHVENVFRKLQCTTRAAATLKALTLGLI